MYVKDSASCLSAYFHDEKTQRLSPTSVALSSVFFSLRILMIPSFVQIRHHDIPKGLTTRNQKNMDMIQIAGMTFLSRHVHLG